MSGKNDNDVDYELMMKAGEKSNFSIIMNKSKSNRAVALQAKKAGKAFGQFAKACIDEGFVLEGGMGEVPVVGLSSYTHIKNTDGDSLMIVAVPHDIIDIAETQGEEQ